MQDTLGMLCAAIDIGSNTTRVLVAEPVDGQLKKVMEQRAYTRINKAIDDDGAICPDKIEEVAEVVATQVRLARELGAETIRAVATAAVREASNGERAAREIGRAAGVEVDILTRRRAASPSSARPRPSAIRSAGRSASSTSAAAPPR
jgi:exopolyphosphatase/guanosine-5'-triphosphate,3'-diphosphate pyrophosphatase